MAPIIRHSESVRPEPSLVHRLPLPDAVGPLNRSFLVVVIPLLACTRRELPLLPLPPKISLTLTPFEAAADP